MNLLTAELKEVPFGWIAAGAEKMGVTGVLTLTLGAWEKRFYYQEGVLIFASSTKEGERFGEFLEAQGVFDRQRMMQLIKESRARGQRFTADLMAEGVLDRSDLEHTLRDLVLIVMGDALRWGEGMCVFSEGLPEGILKGPVHLAIDDAFHKASNVAGMA